MFFFIFAKKNVKIHVILIKSVQADVHRKITKEHFFFFYFNLVNYFFRAATIQAFNYHYL